MAGCQLSTLALRTCPSQRGSLCCMAELTLLSAKTKENNSVAPPCCMAGCQKSPLSQCWLLCSKSLCTIWQNCPLWSCCVAVQLEQSALMLLDAEDYVTVAINHNSLKAVNWGNSQRSRLSSCWKMYHFLQRAKSHMNTYEFPCRKMCILMKETTTTLKMYSNTHPGLDRYIFLSCPKLKVMKHT